MKIKNKKYFYIGIMGLCLIVVGIIFFVLQKKIVQDYVSVAKQGRRTSEDISISFPNTNDAVSSPIEVSGFVKGNWFFEGSFPIFVYNEKGEVLGSGNAVTKEDWMTDAMVPFFARISFQNPGSGIGWITLKKENPSGIKEFDAFYDIPVRFVPDEMQVKVYFQKLGPDSSVNSCTKVYESRRTIKKTDAVARAAINELLKGVNAIERDMKFFSNIPDGVVLRNLKIENGTAYVDFNEALNVGGSCRVSAIRSQIESTLKQFPTVSYVVISVNGSVQEALQP